MIRTISLILAVSCVPAWASVSVEESWTSVTGKQPIQAADVSKMPLNVIDKSMPAKVTFYNPDMNTKREGGAYNLYDERVNSFEDAVKNGRPVTLAADSLGTFGRECNQRGSRCTILIVAKGFDKLFPGYRARFPGLPKDSFVGIVEDTGRDFRRTAGSRFDLASRNRTLANGSPDSFHEHARWIKVKNPCGEDAKARMCDFSGAMVTADAMDKIDVPANREAGVAQSRSVTR